MLQACLSQSRIRVYGYKQGVSAGMPSTYQTDEKGKQTGISNRPRVNYFIYVSHPAGIPVQPVEAWINGHAFDLKKEIVKAPVERALDSSPFEKNKVILVPHTPGVVLMLTPVTKADSLFKLKDVVLSQQNELVIVYQLKDRLFTKQIKALQVLRTEVMQ